MACCPTSERYRGSRSLNTATRGDATKMDEYEPVSMPMSRASANSRSVTAPRMPEPRTSSEMMGSSEEMVVFNDRISTWFMLMLTMSAYGMRLPE